MIVVGLGNPGPEHEATRHNVGFLVAEAARARWRGARWKRRGDFLESTFRLAGKDHHLIEPQTYMNDSGKAVAALLREGADPSDLLIILDDIDLPFGRMRIRESGGDGGHRGLASIISVTGTERIARIRVGVGRPETSCDAVDHVLGEFSADERPKRDAVIERALEALQVALREGVATAMNRFNGLPAPWEEE